MRDVIIARLEDAGRTLVAMPHPVRGRPAEPGACWPDVLQTYWDVMSAGGEDEPAEVAEIRRQEREEGINRVRIQPSSAAIDRLDEVLGWLWFIDRPTHRRLTVARMQIWPQNDRHVFSWRQLSRAFGMSPTQLRRWHMAAVDDILAGLILVDRARTVR